MSRSNKLIFTILVMLLVAPGVAVTTLVCLAPGRWGGAQSLLALPFMAALGLLSPSVWLTYIPSLIVVPVIMSWLSDSSRFAATRRLWLILFSGLMGGILGACVIGPTALVCSRDGGSLATDFLIAGVVAGASAMVIICLIYHYQPPSQMRADPPAR